MKTYMKAGVTISTPWKTTIEAAAYCGIARSTFVQKAAIGGLPQRGDNHCKRWFLDEIDKWIANGFVYPGSAAAQRQAEPPPPLKRRPVFPKVDPALGLRNPKTGKYYYSGGAAARKARTISEASGETSSTVSGQQP